jgi:hypothetical protein
MSIKKLSPEIVSLIHHVELNESGWWKKAVGQVVRGVLWKSKSAMTLAELHAALKRETGIHLPDDVLTKQLDALCNQGSVTRIPGPNFKLTERARVELSTAHGKAVSEQATCHAEFLASCTQHCPKLDGGKIWDVFNKALVGAIQVTGANLFHLLSDGNLERDVDWLAAFLTKFDHQNQEGLRKVLGLFFAPDNHACRNQVLRLLSAHFFAEASQLRPETLAILEGERKARSIKVVLDTNFIFSVLGLHDNPGDDSALSLIDIAQKTGRNLEIKLYVLPSTLDEAQRVLLNQMHMVERIRTTVSMARVALTQPLPSVAKKFFDAASKSAGLTASAFFQPYIDDLRTILRAKGIAVLEAHPTIYHQRQDVIDDVLDEQRREQAELPEQRRKGYETLLHDAVLWHAVNDRRPSDTNSPFEVEYWAVSMDWRLIAFDRSKRRANAAKLPVVLHPSNLVQLVQFWVPRSKELEDSLVDSLRLPLFFQSFDPEDERATVQVLEAISRFENVGDLPEQTLKVVLANQALRGRLRNGDASNDVVFELVRDELLSEHRQTVAQLETTQGTLRTAEETLAAERRGREQSDSQREDAARLLKQAEEKAEAAELRAEKEAKTRAALEEQLRTGETASEIKLREQAEHTNALERRLARQRYVALFLVLPSALGLWAAFAGFGPAVAALPLLAKGWQRWAFQIGIGLLPLATTCIASPWYAARSKHLADWWVVRFASYAGKKAILAPLTATGSAFYQGGAYDWLKSITGFNP